MRLLIFFLVVMPVLFMSCRNDRTYTSNVREHLLDTDSPLDSAKVVEEEAREEYLKNVEKRKAEKARLDALPDNSVIVNEDSSITLIGIVQSSGIRSFDKHSIIADFQIETSRKSFFLVTQRDLGEYWGKRASISGRVVQGWSLSEINSDSGTFDRIPFEVASIMPYHNDSSIIFPYRKPRENYFSYMDTLSGFIKRRKRICADINMDYYLSLDTAFPHPEDTTILLKNIDINPAIDFDTLNYFIDSNIHIRTFGYIAGGYAETIIFETDSIILN